MKKIWQIVLKLKSPEWNRQNDGQTGRMIDRPTLNFINTDNFIREMNFEYKLFTTAQYEYEKTKVGYHFFF